MTVEAHQTKIEIPCYYYWIKFKFGHILNYNVINMKLKYQNKSIIDFVHLRYL